MEIVMVMVMEETLWLRKNNKYKEMTIKIIMMMMMMITVIYWGFLHLGLRYTKLIDNIQMQSKYITYTDNIVFFANVLILLFLPLKKKHLNKKQKPCLCYSNLLNEQIRTICVKKLSAST